MNTYAIGAVATSLAVMTLGFYANERSTPDERTPAPGVILVAVLCGLAWPVVLPVMLAYAVYHAVKT